MSLLLVILAVPVVLLRYIITDHIIHVNLPEEAIYFLNNQVVYGVVSVPDPHIVRKDVLLHYPHIVRKDVLLYMVEQCTYTNVQMELAHILNITMQSFTVKTGCFNHRVVTWLQTSWRQWL